MFASRLRQLYIISDRVIIRTLRSRKYELRGNNPGLDNRLKSFESAGLRIKDENPEEVMEQSESDFYNVGEAYNEHMNETLMGKYETRHHIIKEKYFKENMPNLLTWSEKEQIRHLAMSEPDEWTPEKIAESFPVTAPVVKKLLKYPWKPATEERIARHDSSVMRNWKELKEGSLDIPDSLRTHFLKFSERTIPPLNKKSIKIELKKEENLGEFESIVRRCAANENENQSSNSTNSNSHHLALPVSDSESNGGKKKKAEKGSNSKMTLEELTTKIKNRLEKGTSVDICDKIIIDTVQASGDVQSPVNISKEIELSNEDLESNKLVEFKEKDKPTEVMTYPERIRIPKKAYKKGATYKVNDCFYDHDGKFLYRVLGMSN